MLKNKSKIKQEYLLRWNPWTIKRQIRPKKIKENKRK
jgi:hypothetical protein